MTQVDTPGFITPPPGLVPPRHDTGTQTERVTPQRSPLPAFNPPPPANPSPAPAPTTAAFAAPAAAWLAVLPTGERVPIGDALLIGRNPVRFDAWQRAGLLPIDDPARSVSKTHAVLESAGAGIRVTDLHSTNGVSLVDAAGSVSGVAPGVPTPVPTGTAVLLGTYRVQLVPA